MSTRSHLTVKPARDGLVGSVTDRRVSQASFVLFDERVVGRWVDDTLFR